MKTSGIKIYLFALLAMFFWGFSFVWVKIVYYYYHPLTTVFIRVSLATLLLWIGYGLSRNKEKPQGKDYRWLLLLAFFEPFVYFLGESFGMTYVSSSLASLIIATIPLFTPLAARLWEQENISLFNFLGIILSFTGIAVMVLEPGFSFKGSPAGIALMLVAVAAAIAYTITVKKLAGRYRPGTILRWQYSYGTLLFAPLFFAFDFRHFITVKPDFRLIITLLQLVVFASVLAFFFFIKAVDKLGINKTNVFTNFVPVVTAITAFFVLPEEKFGIETLVGMAIVVAGIFMAQIKNQES